MDFETYAADLYKSFIDFAMADDVSINLHIHRKSQIRLTHSLYYERVGMRSIYICYRDDADACEIYEAVDAYDESVSRCEVVLGNKPVSASSLWEIRRMWIIEDADIASLTL